MILLAGTYERDLFGYKLNPKTQTLTQLYKYPTHITPIKSVAVSYPVATSSSTDNTIKLYDLSTSLELGSHLLETTITSFSFYTHHSLSSFPRNLIAGAEDGSIIIFDVDPFIELETIVGVHKKAVNDVAVHPSGKLALSVGRDCCLAMVNLVRAKKSFGCKVEKEAEIVEYFGNGGERFFMGSGEKVSVHCSEDAKIVGEFVSKKKVLCAVPGENGLILSGGEDRGITAWDTDSGKVAYSIKDAHNSRVKGIVVLTRNQNAGAAEDPYLVASGSSDGVIRVWDIRATSKDKPEPLAEVDTKSRLTTFAGSSFKSITRPQMKKDATEVNAGATEDT